MERYIDNRRRHKITARLYAQFSELHCYNFENIVTTNVKKTYFELKKRFKLILKTYLCT